MNSYIQCQLIRILNLQLNGYKIQDQNMTSRRDKKTPPFFTKVSPQTTEIDYHSMGDFLALGQLGFENNIPGDEKMLSNFIGLYIGYILIPM